MGIGIDEIQHIANLAKIGLTTEEAASLETNLNNILSLVGKMDKADTQNTTPLSHPLDLTQRLRPDQVTEHNQRTSLQALAPKSEAGLYLVPVVIE